MKNYTRKKLPHFQVHRVMSRTAKQQITLRQIAEPYVISGIPPGYYAMDEDALLLPKRKRGEKFIVHYTVMKEAIL